MKEFNYVNLIVREGVVQLIKEEKPAAKRKVRGKGGWWKRSCRATVRPDPHQDQDAAPRRASRPAPLSEAKESSGN
ncbi:hypothetical protein E2C01_023328 [Portunus trituberculatus]|uniref:Uncharacterized protein n=1 Tax=Portunus trituberculatus TaxID=210409 RepID=A0A5B7EAV1_PORTR|nr:hypothetical protein [Portunus trituberculatus]